MDAGSEEKYEGNDSKGGREKQEYDPGEAREKREINWVV
jgi:hypothetical protein